MNTRAIRDSSQVDSTALTALASMAAVDRPLSCDVLLADVEIDSLDLVELTQILEEECGVTVVAGAFSDVASVGDLIEVVRKHVG
jgi:acyl carrier protein